MNYSSLITSALVLAATSTASTDTFAQSAPLLYDSANRLIGLSVDPAIIVSSTGFRFRLDASSGWVSFRPVEDATGKSFSAEPKFVTPDCTGQAYLRVDEFGGASAGIVVDGADEIHSLFYVSKASVVEDLGFSSHMEPSGNCVPESSAPGPAVPAFPNDPNVTGVPNEPFEPPYRIEMEPVSALFDLFRDGFESTWQQEHPSATHALA